MSLTREDFLTTAAAIECDPAMLKAFAVVESAGGGFEADGKPKILFEAQWYGTFTGGKYHQSHPNISSPVWNRSLHKYGPAEYGRLNLAISLDRVAALKSASWGMFQVMGFNHALCGFKDVESFVASMHKSEGEHLKAAIGFLKSAGLVPALRAKNFAALARGYNGAGYAANQYDKKLESAYVAAKKEFP